jgi:uncharacterized protein YjlB
MEGGEGNTGVMVESKGKEGKILSIEQGKKIVLPVGHSHTAYDRAGYGFVSHQQIN